MNEGSFYYLVEGAEGSVLGEIATKQLQIAFTFLFYLTACIYKKVK